MFTSLYLVALSSYLGLTLAGELCLVLHHSNVILGKR